MIFDEMHAVMQTAHNHRLKVTGHCGATEGIKNALRAGYDTMEHGTFMDDEARELLLQRELASFVEHVGFSPVDVIKCATRTGAQIMGRVDEFGTVEVGKLADLLAVDAVLQIEIAAFEDHSRFIAVLQGGFVRAGCLATVSVTDASRVR